MLVHLVYLVYLVGLVCLAQPNKRNKPDNGLLKLGAGPLSGSNRMLGVLYHMRREN